MCEWEAFSQRSWRIGDPLTRSLRRSRRSRRRHDRYPSRRHERRRRRRCSRCRRSKTSRRSQTTRKRRGGLVRVPPHTIELIETHLAESHTARSAREAVKGSQSGRRVRDGQQCQTQHRRGRSSRRPLEFPLRRPWEVGTPSVRAETLDSAVETPLQSMVLGNRWKRHPSTRVRLR